MNRIAFALIILGSSAFLSGCLNDGGGGGDDVLTGRVTLTGIEGLRYETRSQSGVTNDRGEFKYYEGETVSFWIGDLQIAANVPAKPFLTPIDFPADNRELLQTGTADRYGLTTHTLVEEYLAEFDPTTINITRLLLILDQDKTVRLGDEEDTVRNNIELTDRVISQFNEALRNLEGTVNLDADIEGFAADTPKSPINAIVTQICFYPADDYRCKAPPTDQEIANAPEETDDPDVKTRAELEQTKREIEDSRRLVSDRSPETVENFLLEQTGTYNSLATRPYYITPFEANIPASDTALKTLEVKSSDGDAALLALEATSTNANAVMAQRWSAQTGTVEYFVTGDSGSEGEILVSFKPEGDYRWFQRQLRVVVEDAE